MPRKTMTRDARSGIARAKSPARIPSKKRKSFPDNIEHEGVWIAANTHIVRYFPFGCLGGEPRRLMIEEKDLWIVPIVLTSPGYGIVGQCGVVALDAMSLQVLAASPRPEVNQAIVSLRESKRDELEAAFHRARTI
jgi:hypothetical protein